MAPQKAPTNAHQQVSYLACYMFVTLNFVFENKSQ